MVAHGRRPRPSTTVHSTVRKNEKGEIRLFLIKKRPWASIAGKKKKKHLAGVKNILNTDTPGAPDTTPYFQSLSCFTESQAQACWPFSRCVFGHGRPWAAVDGHGCLLEPLELRQQRINHEVELGRSPVHHGMSDGVMYTTSTVSMLGMLTVLIKNSCFFFALLCLFQAPTSRKDGHRRPQKAMAGHGRLTGRSLS
jgi:hypothetical protein